MPGFNRPHTGQPIKHQKYVPNVKRILKNGPNGHVVHKELAKRNDNCLILAGCNCNRVCRVVLYYSTNSLLNHTPVNIQNTFCISLAYIDT